jgi:PelA/Pel-15E family pectate lyase
MLRWILFVLVITSPCGHALNSEVQTDADPATVTAAMVRAVQAFRDQAGFRGGYVYDVSLDGSSRRGEGNATPTEIWVQPPGTPAVGEAFLDAYDASPNPVFLDAAKAAATALLHGQLESGGWADRVDFDPAGKNTGLYRDGRGKAKGRNYSTLDDDKTQSALRFLIRLDQRLNATDPKLHEAVQYALDRLLTAQFANGGFPQGWQKPVEAVPVVRASFPTGDWRTAERRKNYWDYPTLNDGLAGTVVQTLQRAFAATGDVRCRQAQLKFGDFLIRAQLPEPQPAWAQQYNHELQPIWARKFEPPAAAGAESQDVIRTLLTLTEITGERRFLEPIPAALNWLKRVRLPDGQLARFHELQTNRPIYFVRDTYEPTYDDSRMPTHYSFKGSCQVEQLEADYKLLTAGRPRPVKQRSLKSLQKDATKILAELDPDGRWVTDDDGKPVIDTANADPSELLLESRVFSRNLSRLAEYVRTATAASSLPPADK